MAAARYDITIDQGSDFSLELIVKESGTTKDFGPAGGNTWGARAKFRKTLEETTSFDLGASTSGANDGVVNISHGVMMST